MQNGTGFSGSYTDSQKTFRETFKNIQWIQRPDYPPDRKCEGGAGVHAYGLVADIIISHGLAYDLLNMVMTLKIFTGIGIQQKGHPGQRFIHIDIATPKNYRMDVIRPTVWSY